MGLPGEANNMINISWYIFDCRVVAELRYLVDRLRMQVNDRISLARQRKIVQCHVEECSDTFLENLLRIHYLCIAEVNADQHQTIDLMPKNEDLHK